MSPRTKTALLISDWQCDLHDQPFMDRTLALARDLRPDRIVHLGDETDATTLGRWVRDTPGEIEGSLEAQLGATIRNLGRLRAACPESVIDICYSNHSERFAASVRSRIPALRSLPGLTVEALHRLDDFGIRYRREVFEVFPGVVAGHGHQWGLTSANQYAKGTAVVAKLGASVVAGHTHRPLLASVAVGYGLKAANRFYMNVGCSMDFTRAEYITSRSPEWGHGVGVLEYNARTGWIQPHLIVAVDGRFRYGGKWY